MAHCTCPCEYSVNLNLKMDLVKTNWFAALRTIETLNHDISTTLCQGCYNEMNRRSSCSQNISEEQDRRHFAASCLDTRNS